MADRVPSDAKILAALLAERGLDWRSIREAKANIGTDVHERFLHALAKGDPVPNLADFPEDVRGYGQGVLRWWHERQPEVLQAEQVVLSTEHLYAGRFDLRCVFTAEPSSGDFIPNLVGKTALADAKTSKYIGAPYHAQLEGYELAAEECGIGRSDVRVILQLLPDGTYREHPCAATRGMFLSALATYRDQAQIKGAASRWWREQKVRAELKQAA